MIRTSLVARRYGRALFKVSGSKDADVSKVLDVLDSLVDLYKNEKIRKALVSPVIPKAVKRAVLTYSLDQVGAEPKIRSFLDAVLDAGRLAELPGIRQAYQDLIHEERGVVQGEVRSFVSLPDAELKEIAGSLSRITKKDVKLSQSTDRSLLGGFVVRIGNDLVDMSLKSKLEALAQCARGEI